MENNISEPEPIDSDITPSSLPVSATILVSDASSDKSSSNEHTSPTPSSPRPLSILTDVPCRDSLQSVGSVSQRQSVSSLSPTISIPASGPTSPTNSGDLHEVRSVSTSPQPITEPLASSPIYEIRAVIQLQPVPVKTDSSSTKEDGGRLPSSDLKDSSDRTESVEADVESNKEESEENGETIAPLASELPKTPLTNSEAAATLDETVEAAAPVAVTPFDAEPFSLPWGGKRKHSSKRVESKTEIPGEFAMQKLFSNFTNLAKLKIEQVLAESLEKPLQQTLQMGEDSNLDQIISTLGAVAEHSLPALLQNLLIWYEKQTPSRHRSIVKGEKDHLSERRDLAIVFVFCLALIEILKQLDKHPGYEHLVNKILQMAFSSFKQNENVSGPNSVNMNSLADLYAEVVGVLALNRFQAVKNKFNQEMRELRPKESNPIVAHYIIGLIMGLKFIRVKMYPIAAFEGCVQFLHELGKIFIDTANKDIKTAVAGLLVEILQPMASVVTTEVNVPVVRTFVEKLYPHSVEMSTKKRITLNQAMMPMITCLLTVCQKEFFFQNWPPFLNTCLTHIRGRDAKMSRLALESLSRLLWVYIVRWKGESNQITNQRLNSITSVLFPRGQRTHVPKDSPLNIHVKLIMYIASGRLDYAIRDIIFDLLSVSQKKQANLTILPERMAIGLRAFLVISDNLQTKNRDPPMPQSMGVMPSGSTLRVKKTLPNRVLTEESARQIGIVAYYPAIRKTFTYILNQLDAQVGKPLITTRADMRDKEADEVITMEKKPKIDLLRTCVAAIPRLLPSPDVRLKDIIETIVRYAAHIDDDLRRHSYNTLQNLLVNFVDSRAEVLNSFINLVCNEITDQQALLLDSVLRMLNSLMSHWKNQLQNPEQNPNVKQPRHDVIGFQKIAIHNVEGLALVMLCSCHQTTRKIAVNLLKEAFNLMKELSVEDSTHCAITHIDRIIPHILEDIMQDLPPHDRSLIVNASSTTLDLQWLTDQTSRIWLSYSPTTSATSDSAPTDTNTSKSSKQSGDKVTPQYSVSSNPWRLVITGMLEYDYMTKNFHNAASAAWPVVKSRVQSLFPLVDPANSLNEQRASGILTRGVKKIHSDRDLNKLLWHNYIAMAACLAPGSQKKPWQKSSSEDMSSILEKSGSMLNLTTESSSTSFYQLLSPLLRSDQSEARDSTVFALSHISPVSLQEMFDVMGPLIKEVLERKEQRRRRKRGNLLRLSIFKLFHGLAENRILTHRSSSQFDEDCYAVQSFYIDFIDNAMILLETETDQDLMVLQDVRRHFCSFIHALINNTAVETREIMLSVRTRSSLFHLFSTWSHTVNSGAFIPASRFDRFPDNFTPLQFSAMDAMASLLGCGKVFDPIALERAEGFLYHWLDRLLKSSDPPAFQIGQLACTNLLRNNEDINRMLDWTITKCYYGDKQVSPGCFASLCTIFLERSALYPCDPIAVLTTALLHSNSQYTNLKELSSQLLHRLMHDYLRETSESRPELTESALEAHNDLNNISASGFVNMSSVGISAKLADVYPRFTLRVFTEVCKRLTGAETDVCTSLLRSLTPWCRNFDLCDPGFPMTLEGYQKQDNVQSAQQIGDTCVVLNNLLHITCEWNERAGIEIEALWQTLAQKKNNLKHILKYLLLVSGVSPYTLLNHVKKIVVYLSRLPALRVMEEMMNEFLCLDTFPFILERCGTLPFFKISDYRMKGSQTNDRTSDLMPVNSDITLTYEQGRSMSKSFSEMQKQASFEVNHSTDGDGMRKHDINQLKVSDQYISTELWQTLDDPLLVNTIQRCFIALSLVSEALMDHNIHWMTQLPTLLHCSYLGFDHHKAIVYEHCKKVLLALIYTVLDKHPSLQSLVLSNYTSISPDPSNARSKCPLLGSQSTGHDVKFPGSPKLLLNQTDSSQESDETISDNPPSLDLDTALHNIINVLSARKDRPLWFYETVTVRQPCLKSTEELRYLYTNTIFVFKACLPHELVDRRWSQTALQFLMNCSSRHYAGRSMQIHSLLAVPMTLSTLSEITSRLVGVVCESSDEMQGFVTEILRTIQQSAASLDLQSPSNLMRASAKHDMFISTPNLDMSSHGKHKKADSGTKSSGTRGGHARSHKRSSSVSLSGAGGRGSVLPLATSSVILGGDDDQNYRMRGGTMGDNFSTDQENLDTLVQMLWIAVSLLESDFEYEFQLAVELVGLVLQHLKLDNIECQRRLNKKLDQLKWRKYPGLLHLLVKGLTSTQTAVCTWKLLTHLIMSTDISVICSNKYGFPYIVFCFLPLFVQHFTNPTQLCIDAAQNIVEAAEGIAGSQSMSHLATVMRNYATISISTKDPKNWTKCVVKYVTDVYGTEPLYVITLLLEMLEQGLPGVQSPILIILQCILHYIEIDNLPSRSICTDIIATVVKFIEGPHYSEAQLILKSVVKSSSSLIPAGAKSQVPSLPAGLQRLHHHTSFAETELLVKKDLPGLTLDFGYDVGSTPVIGEVYILPPREPRAESLVNASPKKPDSNPLSSSSVSSADSICNWRRPHHSKLRVREKLTSLLSAAGQRVGVIKSPSVIFSQTSEAGDRQTDADGSSEEIESHTTEDRALEDSSVSDPYGDHCIKDFDFLDDETSSGDDEEYGFGLTMTRKKRLNHHHLPEVTKSDVLAKAACKSPEPELDPEAYLEADPEAEPSTKSTADDQPDLVGGSRGDVVGDSGGEDVITPVNVEITVGPEDNSDDKGSSSESASIHSDEEKDPSEAETEVIGVPVGDTLTHWRNIVSQALGSQTTANSLVDVFTIIGQLYSECSRTLTCITQDVCTFIKQSPSLSELSNLLSQESRAIGSAFVFANSSAMLSIAGNESFSFCLLQFDENYSEFIEKRRNVLKVLNEVKEDCLKRRPTSSTGVDSALPIQILELCEKLYKLRYQWLQLNKSYSELVKTFEDVVSKKQGVDQSADVAQLHRKLTGLKRQEANRDSDISVFSETEWEEVEIAGMLTSGNNQSLSNAVRYLDSCREGSLEDLFGVSHRDTIDVCLTIFCRNAMKEVKGCFHAVVSTIDLNVNQRELATLKIRLDKEKGNLEPSYAVVAPTLTSSPLPIHVYPDLDILQASSL